METLDPKIYTDKILEDLKNFETTNVLVIGDVGVDEYVNGSVRRISPEAPVPILEVQTEEKRLGLSTNVAQNIKALGGNPLLFSICGDDGCAKDLFALLREAEVDSNYLIIDESRPTTRKVRVMSEMHHIVRVDYEKKKFLKQEVEAKLFRAIQEKLPNVDAVILQDYAKGVLSEGLIQKVIALAKKENVKILVDPHASTPIHYYRGADLMTPNAKEAIQLSQLPIDDLRNVSESMSEVGDEILNHLGSEKLVITRSKEGMSLFQEGKIYHIPTFARQVYDVTGAGDTVIASLALAWASGMDLISSCILANYAAGVVVGKVGCVPCTIDELRDWMQRH